MKGTIFGILEAGGEEHKFQLKVVEEGCISGSH